MCLIELTIPLCLKSSPSLGLMIDLLNGLNYVFSPLRFPPLSIEDPHDFSNILEGCIKASLYPLSSMLFWWIPSIGNLSLREEGEIVLV